MTELLQQKETMNLILQQVNDKKMELDLVNEAIKEARCQMENEAQVC